MPRKHKSPEARIQYAALPYRWLPNGAGLEVLLVTSRETRRWVIPKGWPMRGRKGCQTAAREAFEEAGLDGEVARQSIGAYTYGKKLKDGTVVTCSVRVYPFAVASQRARWPEMGEREARWFTPEMAAQAVDEPELAALIRRLKDGLGAGGQRPER